MPDPSRVRQVERVQTQEALEHLVSLLEFHASVQEDAYGRRLARIANPEVREVLERVVGRSREDRSELDAIVRLWRRLAPPARGAEPAAPEPMSLRELVEGWVEVKRTAAHLYRSAAEAAPAPGIAERLRRLAAREDEDAADLEALL